MVLAHHILEAAKAPLAADATARPEAAGFEVLDEAIERLEHRFGHA